jgi:hypothetical protein
MHIVYQLRKTRLLLVSDGANGAESITVSDMWFLVFGFRVLVGGNRKMILARGDYVAASEPCSFC